MSIITKIETFVSGTLCVVRVTTDDGLVGYGQTAPSVPEITEQVLHRLVARHFLGRDPWELAALVDETVRAEYKYLGGFLFRALSGVDTAIWDLQGRATGQPVYKLLGGAVRDRVPVYASSMSREIPVDEEVGRIADAVEKYGLRCAKVKIGIRNGRDAELWEGRTSALVPAMRKHFGDDFWLSADANGAYSPGGAVQVGRKLEEYGVFHLEEPNPCWELDNMKYVADHLDLPIGAGEQEWSLEIIRRMIAERLVDVIQPDVCYVGGLTRARQVAQLADLNGIPCTPHSSGHSMIKIFTAHLVMASPACTQFQEWSVEPPGSVSASSSKEPRPAGFSSEVYGPIPSVQDGYITLDDTPGWGVEILPSFLEKAARQVTGLE